MIFITIVCSNLCLAMYFDMFTTTHIETHCFLGQMQAGPAEGSRNGDELFRDPSAGPKINNPLTWI